jgi:hypothetical protein
MGRWIELEFIDFLRRTHTVSTLANPSNLCTGCHLSFVICHLTRFFALGLRPDPRRASAGMAREPRFGVGFADYYVNNNFPPDILAIIST